MAIQKVLEAYGSDIIGSHVEVSTGGHEILNPSGTSMAQEEKMQFTGNVTVTDDSTNGKTVVNIEDSGHTIKNSSGTAMTQQPNMKFADSFVTNDSVGEATVVENVKEVASADYPSETEDGMYLITDGEGAVIGPASDDKVEVVADGNTTYATLLNAIYSDSKFDISKVNECVTTLKIGASIFHLFGISGNESYFSAACLNSQLPATEEIRVSSSSYYNRYRQGQFSDLSSTKPSSGTKITLYYGNKKATVDLQTTANRCWYDSENTVKQKLDVYDGMIAKSGSFTLFAVGSGNNGGWGYGLVCPFIHDKSKIVTVTGAQIVFVGNITDTNKLTVHDNTAGCITFKYNGTSDLTNKLIAISITLS